MEKIKLFPIRVSIAARMLRDREDGQAMVEYALILALVAVAVVGVLQALGSTVTNVFNSVNGSL